METDEKKLLLHTCCGPCASGCAGLLQENGRDFVLYFSNSNLCDEAEYEKRLTAARQLAESLGVELIADPYDHDAWLNAVAGFEAEPERGERCRYCFAFSLGRTAKLAAERGMNFATSLTVSPHKSSKLIFEIGSEWNCFEPWDFKKKDGFKKSIENSKKLNLFRQDFCGCEFSQRERERMKK